MPNCHTRPHNVTTKIPQARAIATQIRHAPHAQTQVSVVDALAGVLGVGEEGAAHGIVPRDGSGSARNDNASVQDYVAAKRINSTAQSFAARVLKDRGIKETRGWSVALEDGEEHVELNGDDFVLSTNED